MLNCHFHGFLYSFTDSNTWYYYYKFIPAVLLVEFEHSFYVHISLTCTSFHFYVQ